MKALRGIVFAAAMTGCTSFSNPSGADRLTDGAVPDRTSAIVVVSTRAPGPCANGLWMNLKIFRVEDSVNSDKAVFSPVDISSMKSDFPDHTGFLSVFRLAPGDYNAAAAVSFNATMKTLPVAPFTLAPGEVVYLGEFAATRTCRGNLAATRPATFTDEFDPEFRDESARDVGLLKSKNARFENAAITKRLLRFTGSIHP